MKVTCAECGEELMGAVNRCWRCGTVVISRPGSATLPPVKRPPQPITAELVILDDAADEDAADESAPATSQHKDSPAGDTAARDAATDAVMAGVATSDNGASVQGESSAAGPPTASDAIEASRSDSSPPTSVADAKAADAAPLVIVDQGAAAGAKPASTNELADRYFDAPRPAYYPKHAASTGGAVGAMVLAVMSLGFAYFTIGAVFTALLGIGLGAWGVYSNHRGLAVTAMVLCCLAVALAAIFGVFHLYTELNGTSPFFPGGVSEFE